MSIDKKITFKSVNVLAIVSVIAWVALVAYIVITNPS